MIGVVAENAERRRVKRKVHPFRDRQADPPRGQNTSKLTMCEERDVAFYRPKTGDER